MSELREAACGISCGKAGLVRCCFVQTSTRELVQGTSYLPDWQRRVKSLGEWPYTFSADKCLRIYVGF